MLKANTQILTHPPTRDAMRFEKETPKARKQRVELLKEQVKRGEYAVDPEKVAEGLLDSPLWKHGRNVLKLEEFPHPNGTDSLITYRGSNKATWIRTADGDIRMLDQQAMREFRQHIKNLRESRTEPKKEK